jgi:hypothetical protein
MQAASCKGRPEQGPDHAAHGELPSVLEAMHQVIHRERVHVRGEAAVIGRRSFPAFMTGE